MSFPTFTPQRPNAALYKFNVGESFLKGLQTVANVDLERAAEARLLEKSRIDNEISQRLLPLQAEKLRAEIGLLGAQADRNLAMAKVAGTQTVTQGLAANEAALDAAAANLINEKGLSVPGMEASYIENPAPKLNLETPITPLDDEGPSIFLEDDLGDSGGKGGPFEGLPEVQGQPLMPVSGAEGVGGKLPVSAGQMNLPGAAGQPAQLSSPLRGDAPFSLNSRPPKLDEDEDGESSNPLTSLSAPAPRAVVKTPSQIYTDFTARQRMAWQANEAFKNDKNNMKLRVNNKLWAEATVRDEQSINGLLQPYGLNFQIADALTKQFGGMPDILDRAVKMKQLGSPEDGVPAGAEWDVVAKGLSNQQTRLAAGLQLQDPQKRLEYITKGQEALAKLVGPDGKITNQPLYDQLSLEMDSKLGLPTGISAFKYRFDRLQDRSSKLGLAAGSGISYGDITPEQAPAELARLNEEMVALAVEKSPYFGSGDREKMGVWLSSPETRNLPFVTSVQTDFFTGDAPLFPTKQENVYKIWSPKDKSWKLYDLNEKPKEPTTTYVNSEVAFIDEPSDNPLTREEFLKRGDVAARQVATAPLLPKSFTKAVSESVRDLPWGVKGLVPTATERRRSEREWEMNRVSPEQRMTELRNKVSELDKQITKMGPSTSKEYRSIVRERNQTASMLNELIRRETPSSFVL